MLGQQPLQVVDGAIGQGPEGQGDVEVAEPIGLQFGTGHLHAHELQAFVAHVESGLDHHDGIVVEQGPVVGHGLREDEGLDRGVQILEDEGGHEVALLGIAALEFGDDTADDLDAAAVIAGCGHGLGVVVAQLGQGAVGEPGQRALEAH